MLDKSMPGASCGFSGLEGKRKLCNFDAGPAPVARDFQTLSYYQCHNHITWSCLMRRTSPGHRCFASLSYGPLLFALPIPDEDPNTPSVYLKDLAVVQFRSTFRSRLVILRH